MTVDALTKTRNAFSAALVLVARCAPRFIAAVLADAHVRATESPSYQCPFPPLAVVHCTAVDCAKTELLVIAITEHATSAFVNFIC